MNSVICNINSLVSWAISQRAVLGSNQGSSCMTGGSQSLKGRLNGSEAGVMVLDPTDRRCLAMVADVSLARTSRARHRRIGPRQKDGRRVVAGGGGVHVRGRRRAGLSLPFELPATGKKLVFSKTGGDPKLASAVRPQESIRQGLNLVWAIVWLAIGLGIVPALRSPRSSPSCLDKHRWPSRPSASSDSSCSPARLGQDCDVPDRRSIHRNESKATA